MASSELGAGDQRKTRHVPSPKKSHSLLRKRDPLLFQSRGAEFATKAHDKERKECFLLPKRTSRDLQERRYLQKKTATR